ncbi:hypothetical protein AAFF_G00426860 [Aldrovandia affinis]|uniref:Uncharacterized protein n=1 Tax=Aldrovandia affinis TaxID=143900 RepID=A0AAD7S9C5_9TELE|nr:hypothetical protein AAFF_G00426860 [Aldrovandia affinis]
MQVSCQEDVMICEDKLESLNLLQVDSLVRKTSDIEVTLKRTRSGRIIRSTLERKDTKVCSTIRNRSISEPNNKVSQFAFPSSQDNAPVPKRRKFSEPKDHY